MVSLVLHALRALTAEIATVGTHAASVSSTMPHKTFEMK
jgi:hypothetical protein